MVAKREPESVVVSVSTHPLVSNKTASVVYPNLRSVQDEEWWRRENRKQHLSPSLRSLMHPLVSGPLASLPKEKAGSR